MRTVRTVRTRARPHRADRTHRRAELLDAAVGAIRRFGASVSMERLAAEAGVTKPILYRHFGDRSGLVDALAERFASELMAELDAALSRAGSPRETLESTIDAYVAFIERDTELYGFLVQRFAAKGTLLGFMQTVGHRVATVLGEQLRAAGQDSGGAEPMAHGIVGMVHAAGHWWVEHRSMPRARLVEYLADVLWAGLGTLLLERSTT